MSDVDCIECDAVF